MRYRLFTGSACLVTVGLLATGLALGCGSDEPAKPAATPAAAPASEAMSAEEIPGQGADSLITDGVIPESYPSDIPTYPGSEPGPAVAVPGLGLFATFLTDDAEDQILEHFRTSLADNGWSVSDAAVGGLDATKDARSVEIRIRTDENGRTEIALNISEG